MKGKRAKIQKMSKVLQSTRFKNIDGYMWKRYASEKGCPVLALAADQIENEEPRDSIRTARSGKARSQSRWKHCFGWCSSMLCTAPIRNVETVQSAVGDMSGRAAYCFRNETILVLVPSPRPSRAGCQPAAHYDFDPSRATHMGTPSRRPDPGRAPESRYRSRRPVARVPRRTAVTGLFK